MSNNPHTTEYDFRKLPLFDFHILGMVYEYAFERSGIVKIYNEDEEDNIGWKYQLWINGKQEGKEIEYYQNGFVHRICYYSNGKLNGDFTSFHENGEVEEVSTYVNGKKQGCSMYWNDQGVFTEYEEYKDDSLHGCHLSWYDNGQLSTFEEFKDGELHGSCFVWFENGVLVNECFFENGKYCDIQTKWHPTGELKTKTYYKDGHIEKTFDFYKKSGIKKLDSYYSDANYRIVYYETGDIKEIEVASLDFTKIEIWYYDKDFNLMRFFKRDTSLKISSTQLIYEGMEKIDIDYDINGIGKHVRPRRR